MPASLWPGTVQLATVSDVNGPITRSSASPFFNILVPCPPTVRSCERVPVLLTCRVIVAPAGTSMADGLTEMSASVTSNSVAPAAAVWPAAAL